MTAKNVLYSKIKNRLPPLATTGCAKAPGHLAIFVKRTDNQKPLSGVQVKAAGPSPANGSTGSDGWIIFASRDPGSYQADISLPQDLRMYRLPKPTLSGSVPGCGTEILEFEVSPPPKVGLALSFRAVLFKKDANPIPDTIKDFQVLTEAEFPRTNHLLADGESQAVIQIQLIKLNDQGKSGRDITLAGPGEHFNEGNVILELSSGEFGELSYGGKSGTKISVPVKDISSGKSALDKDKGVLFTTSKKIGEAKLTAHIENAAQYEYVASFNPSSGSKDLTVGSGLVGQKTNGYDGRKVQWFLRKSGFLAYKEAKLHENDASREWTDIKDIDIDGSFGERSARCLRDFQRVARGSFRNQTVKQVVPTLKAAVSAQATPEVIAELLEWRNKGYKVEPYNGYARLRTSGDKAINEEVRIVYGALLVLNGDDAKGFVEIKSTIGESVCHWDGHDIVVADEIRSGIKLFEKDVLKFRLHDADPSGPGSGAPVLEDENLSPKFAEKVKATVRALRREQQAASTGADCHDVRVYEGYRSVARQQSLYEKGRYRWTDQGKWKYDKTAPNPAPASLTHTDGEPCKHPAETIPLGKCLVHPHGSPQGQPCKHGDQTRPVGTCAEHPWGNPPAQPCSHPANEVRKPGTCYKHPIGITVTNAPGDSRSSWHQYGLAVDLIFNDASGQAAWPDAGDWDHNGAVAKANGLRWGGDWDDPDTPHIQLPQPPNDSPKNDPHRKKYDDTSGSELDKLKAVWSLF